MNREEVLKMLQHISKRTGFSVSEVNYMARVIAQADSDPLPTEEWGQPFDYDDYGKMSLDPNDTFSECINAEVPEPNAQVDLLYALKEFERDVKAADAFYAGRSDSRSLSANWLIFENHWKWDRFWALRHPNPRTRLAFQHSFAEIDASRKRLAEKAEGLLRKRSVMVM